MKQITILCVTGFMVIQASKAAALDQAIDVQPVILEDTTAKSQSPFSNISVNDPKQGFKNLFSTAVEGDEINKARLNPQAVTFVKNFIEKNSRGYLAMKEWGRGYFNMMDEVLTQHGIPKELKYLAVIESGLKQNARSWAGAVGPWAFMPATAREYGLRVSKGIDERVDYLKSTHAAARMLTELYEKYNDWLLVIAAYNSGPGWVDRAIRRTGGNRDFWTLQHYLPNETMNHVKKFIGAHYIFEGEGGITTLTRSETREMMTNNPEALAEDEIAGSTSYAISGRFSSDVIMRHVEMDRESFNRYNPGFDNEIALNGKYQLRLPTSKMNIFVARRYLILEESIQQILKTSATR